ncbi:hypothetical protein TRFO_03123 [Tritrichomonas foetus]|uniref:USP domain-containing protein n=1 Tax=Tritrichomonas foetus TaxID=1144522 RepID=A0A1J4KS72_9EUKA|nr:hypothetical protein TRFO_03123 [Tritrichomonas foetus]|eukprot:OHT14107.1 hypothetical protein TRFO_03123 [Tritrichomonas foetus]
MDQLLKEARIPENQEICFDKMKEILLNYLTTDNLFSCQKDDEINNFFKKDFFRLITFLTNSFSEEYGDFYINNKILELIPIFYDIILKKNSNICKSFSLLTLKLENIKNYPSSMLESLFPEDKILELFSIYQKNPNFEILDIILEATICSLNKLDQPNSATSQNNFNLIIGNQFFLAFQEIFVNVLDFLCTRFDYNQCIYLIITRVFTNLEKFYSFLNLVNSHQENNKNDTIYFIDENLIEKFYFSLFESHLKVLQSESMEKQLYSAQKFSYFHHNFSFFSQWVEKSKPLIKFNNIEGHDNVQFEITKIIRIICQFQQIDEETLNSLIFRIENSDSSQKKIFMEHFAIAASFAHELIVYKVIQKFINDINTDINHINREKQKYNLNDIDENKNITEKNDFSEKNMNHVNDFKGLDDVNSMINYSNCVLLGICAINLLKTQPNISNYIIEYIESKYSTDMTFIKVLEDIYEHSPNHRNSMMIKCINQFKCVNQEGNKGNSIPESTFLMMFSILNLFDQDESSNLLEYLIMYNPDFIDNTKFDELIFKICMKCQIPLKEEQKDFIVRFMTKSIERSDLIFEIIQKRGIYIFANNHWISVVKSLSNNKIKELFVVFMKNIFPYIYNIANEVTIMKDLITFSLKYLTSLLIEYSNENYTSNNGNESNFKFMNSLIFDCLYSILLYIIPGEREFYIVLLVNELYKESNIILDSFSLDVHSLANYLKFIRKIICKFEYMIDISQIGYKRHRPIKRSPDTFIITIHSQFELDTPNNDLLLYVTPKNTIREIISSICMIKKYYDSNAISLTMNNSTNYLDLDTTLEENGILNTSTLYLHLVDALHISHSFLLITHFIYSNLRKIYDYLESLIANIPNEMKFIKEYFKLLSILPTFDKMKNQMINANYIKNIITTDNHYRLFVLQEISDRLKDGQYLQFFTQNKFFSDIKSILSKNLNEKLLLEIVTILNFEEKIDSLNQTQNLEITSILINKFMEVKYLATQIQIIKYLNKLRQFENSINNKENGQNSVSEEDYGKEPIQEMIASNDSFLKLCSFPSNGNEIDGYSINYSKNNHSDTYLKMELSDHIDNLFSSFSQETKIAIFDKLIMFLNDAINLEGNPSNYFSRLLSVMIISEENDFLEDVFLECVSQLDEIDSKDFNHIAYFIGKILELDQQCILNLDDERIFYLIDLAFNDFNNMHQDAIFSILKPIITRNNQNKIDNNDYYSAINEYIQSFETDRWNYSPSVHQKKCEFCGLRNLGSTCYMNSIFQILANNKGFLNRLLSYSANISHTGNNEITKNHSTENGVCTHKSDKSLLTDHLTEIFAKLEYSINGYVDTEPFSNYWKIEEYPPFDIRIQEDAEEFLHILLDKLPKYVTEPLSGKNTNTFEGISVNFERTLEEEFYTISIPLSDSFSESMKTFTKPIIFANNNKYNAENLGKIDAKRTTKIIKLPDTLIIHLKRFDFDVKQGKRTKLNDEFNFPDKFNILDYFPDIELNNDQTTFILTGIVTHSGTAEGGHYNAIVKKNNEWICFNDNDVSKIDDEKFIEISKGKKNSQIAAYLLVYEKDQNFQNENQILKYDDELIQQILSENERLKQIQSLFTTPMALFFLNLENPSLLANFYIRVFCHSSLSMHSTKFSDAIINYFGKENIQSSTSNNTSKQISNITSNQNSQICCIFNNQHLHVFNALINAPDDIAASLVNIVSTICTFAQANQIRNITFNLFDYVANYISSWRVLERFGDIVDSFVSSHLNESISLKYPEAIINLVSSFYKSQPGKVAMKFVNLSSFFHSLFLLNDFTDKRLVNQFFDKYSFQIKESKFYKDYFAHITDYNLNNFDQLKSSTFQDLNQIPPVELLNKVPTQNKQINIKIPRFNNISFKINSQKEKNSTESVGNRFKLLNQELSDTYSIIIDKISNNKEFIAFVKNHDEINYDLFMNSLLEKIDDNSNLILTIPVILFYFLLSRYQSLRSIGMHEISWYIENMMIYQNTKLKENKLTILVDDAMNLLDSVIEPMTSFYFAHQNDPTLCQCKKCKNNLQYSHGIEISYCFCSIYHYIEPKNEHIRVIEKIMNLNVQFTNPGNFIFFQSHLYFLLSYFNPIKIFPIAENRFNEVIEILNYKGNCNCANNQQRVELIRKNISGFLKVIIECHSNFFLKILREPVFQLFLSDNSFVSETTQVFSKYLQKYSMMCRKLSSSQNSLHNPQRANLLDKSFNKNINENKTKCESSTANDLADMSITDISQEIVEEKNDIFDDTFEKEFDILIEISQAILKIYIENIKIIISDGRLFHCVENLVDIMSIDNSTSLVEGVFTYIDVIISKSRVFSTFSIMINVVSKNQIKLTPNLLKLVPNYYILLYENLRNPSAFDVITDFIVLCSKICHEIGFELVNTILCKTIESLYLPSTWKIISVASMCCFDCDQAKKISNLIVKVGSTKAEMIENEHLIKCIINLEKFIKDNDFEWASNLVDVIFNSTKLNDNLIQFCNTLYKCYSTGKLIEVIEDNVESLHFPEKFREFMKAFHIIILIFQIDPDCCNYFLDKYPNIVTDQWPEETFDFQFLFDSNID